MSSRIEAAERRAADAARRLVDANTAAAVAQDNLNRALDDLAVELSANDNSIGSDDS